MSTVTPVTEHLLRGMPLSTADADSKDGRGRVLIVAGCIGLPGAVLLAANSAMRAGAGKLQLAVCRDLAIPIGIAVPEALVIGLPQTEAGAIRCAAADDIARQVECCDALLIGPGLADDAESGGLVAGLIRSAGDAAVVLDAGAFAALCSDSALVRHHPQPAVITPHAGEMARLLNQEREAIEADPLAAARAATERFGTITVMKGARTFIVAPDGRAWCYEAGHVGLATSGSGDTLAGLIAGLVARGTEPGAAAIWGVFAHGEAGRRLARRYGGIGCLAREIPAEIPRILADVLT